MSEEARHMADITEKLANFVIETDTEVSTAVTDTGQSGGPQLCSGVVCASCVMLWDLMTDCLLNL